MYEILTVAISLIGSLLLNGVFFHINKTGLKESDKTFKQQLQKIQTQLKEYEKDLSETAKHSDIDSIRRDIDELEEIIATFKQQLQAMSRQFKEHEKDLSETSIYSDIDSIRRDIDELKRRITTSSSGSTSGENNQQIVNLLNQLAKRIVAIESKQKSTGSNEEILEYIRRIEAETKQDLRSLNSKIDRLGDSTPAPPINPTKPSEPIPQTRPTIYTPANKKVVVPSPDYVLTLINGVTQLESSTFSISYELGKLKDGLLNVKKNGDFDDLEEVMNQIHDLIKKYIYDSDSKVSADEWNMLEQFLIHSGYEPIPVKEGDSIIPYRTYFERPIPATGGPTDTIKQIQLMPFVLSYLDCGETEVLKLCGKCTYYK